MSLRVGVGLERIGKDADAVRRNCVAALGFGFGASGSGTSSLTLLTSVRTCEETSKVDDGRRSLHCESRRLARRFRHRGAPEKFICSG